MFIIKGKYNTADVFTDFIDQSAISQIQNLVNQPFVAGSRICMMPDVHAGIGCTVGTTMTVKDKACPNLVGVDIGCGMAVAQLKEDMFDPEKLDAVIYGSRISGAEKRTEAHPLFDGQKIRALRCSQDISLERAAASCGTLGGGNHFIEVDRDKNGKLYLIIHSGSRHLGVEVANYYQKEAYRHLTGTDRESLLACRKTIEEMKATGRQREIQKYLEEARKGHPTDVPEAFAYCTGSLFDDYLHDIKIVQDYATRNRDAMMSDIIAGMGFHVEDAFCTIHNYIDTDQMILRKGAVSAQDGERLVIPINMRDGSLICTGKGNPDWNYSAPHGAGRALSRKEAKELLTVEEFKAEMSGIYSSSVGQDTLDESPMAYKGIDDIVNNIGPTAKVEKIIKPVYNFKTGSIERGKQ